MGERERNRCRGRLEALLGADLDPDAARRLAIAELRRAVGFDRWCWPLTDPASALATGGIGEFNFWSSLPRLVALEEHGDLASKPRLVLGERRTASLSGETGGDLARSVRWRECLEPYGIGDELMTACRDRHGCWGSVELMRDRRDRPFSEDDVRLLQDLSPVLGTLLRRAAARGWRADTTRADALAPGTLILDGQLRVVGRTPSVTAWLADFPPTGDMLPAGIYETAARASTPAAAAHGLPARTRIRTQSGRWSVVEGAGLDGGAAGCVAVTIRAAAGGEVCDLLCRVHDLTTRERELVARLRSGPQTGALAGTLGISRYTVQDHLKAIFTKTGTRTRGELLAFLTGGPSLI
jgi:DNA-binding CsgD family transcriptional regulator